MPTTLSPTDPLLVTKAGKPKHRFTWDEKLRLLDPTADPADTEERLKVFQELFAFRRTNAIATRVGHGPRSWTALRGSLTIQHIARHLLANTVETIEPQWYGARSFETTRFMCIDVDADRSSGESPRAKQPPKPSLDERRRRVEQAFERMGVNSRSPKEVLVVRTPSGGFHYYLFFQALQSIYQLEGVLGYAGLAHKPGEIEFFPSTKQGLRLPFGYCPDRPHNPRRWIQFIDRYRYGAIKRHSLATLYENAEANLINAPTQTKPIPTPRISSPTPYLGQSKSGTTQNKARPPYPTDSTTPITNINSRSVVEHLMELGIRERGTRTTILKTLATLLIWHRHQSAAQAAETLVTWALHPRHNSEDIQADLKHGTNKVATHIATMCRWYETHKKTTPSRLQDTDPKFTPGEIATLKATLQPIPSDEREDQAHFLLRFLHFAKCHGTPTPDGKAWEAAPAVRSVIRRWPGCHHMNYRTRIDHATAAGILAVTKPHSQGQNGPGRARTYRLAVAPDPETPATIDYDTALKILSTLCHAGVSETSEPEHTSPPNHGDNHVPHEPQNDTRQTTGAHTPALRPPRPPVDLGFGPHQRHPQPHETPDLLGENHGPISTLLPKRLRRETSHDEELQQLIESEAARFAAGRNAASIGPNLGPKRKSRPTDVPP